MKKIPEHTLTFIDSWLSLRSAWAEIPGFVVAIAKDGKLLFNKAYGYANIEAQEAMRPDHVFRIASHSKTFTATVLFQLQEEKALRIDDPAAMYLPWLREHADTRWSNVTIRQLLSHSAGVIRDGSNSEYWKTREPFPDLEQFKRDILEQPLVVESNTRLKYSNYGYALLGCIIDNITGMTYHEAVTARIIEPLGLKNTVPEYREGDSETYATGYSRIGLKHWRYAFDHRTTGALVAATGFSAIAEDLTKYWSAQLVGSGLLLSDASKREMQRLAWTIEKEPDETYGLGIARMRRGSRTTIGHGGGFPGFVTKSEIDPDDSLCIVVLTNSWDGIASTIVGALYGLIDELGDADPDPALLPYEGRFDEVWGITEFCANAQGLRQIWPNSWYPLWQVDQLEKIGEHEFRPTQTNGYDVPGETVTFDIQHGKSLRVKIGGSWCQTTLDGDIQS